jgi:signal transduction histidine kinase
MIRVFGCIFQQHDLRLVVLAALLCALASATALSMIARARAVTSARARAVWLIGAGAVAGCGIWATHFVAMLAYQTGLPIAFTPGLTILSAVIAMSLCGVGFAVAVSRAGGTAGGMITGGAISAMHYTGMAAVDLPAKAVWDMRYVLASVLIGVSVSGLALHFAVRRKSRADYIWSAGLFIAAIVGMHFTGMAAVTFIPEYGHLISGAVMAPFALAIVVTASAAFIVAQALIVAVVDRHLEARARGEAQRMREHIAELEATQQALTEASAQLSAALDAAQAANKSKSAFLASMSHELRTPLNAVLGFSETMLGELLGPLGAPRYREYLESIHASGAHLLSLINDILDIARFDAGHGELVEDIFDPAAEITDAERMMAAQARKAGVTLITELSPDIPHLRADRRRVRQILLNLLSNALKFTHAGGTVTVRAYLTAEGLAIEVTDTGIGMRREDFSKALEPFGQVDSSLARKYEGPGLGLPLTRQMVELHGGRLTLESVLGQGTTVTVILPAARLAVTEMAARSVA